MTIITYPFGRPVALILKVAVLLSLAAASGCRKNAANNSDHVVRVVSWGGAFQQALSDDWWNPSAKFCGVKIEPDSWDGNYGALTTRIEKGINEWDLVHVEAQYVSNPEAATLFQSVDTNGFPIDPRIPKNPRAVPLLEYGYVLAYRRDLIHNETPPDWRDFFDTRRYPGRRAMRDFPVGNIEIALLAQGYNLDTDLYNKDLSRAQLESRVDSALDYLAKVDNDTLWWTTGDQLQRFLTSGDVAMAAAWSGRVLSAYKELCPASSVEKCKLRADAHTSLVSTDWWIIPKGAPNAQNAARFLSCLYESPDSPSEASRFSTSQGYLASIQNLQITDAAANYYLQIGSSGDPNIRHRISEAFWGTNFQWISNRWRTWRLKH